MSTAAEYDPYHDDDYFPCLHDVDCPCGDGPAPATDPALHELIRSAKPPPKHTPAPRTRAGATRTNPTPEPEPAPENDTGPSPSGAILGDMSPGDPSPADPSPADPGGTDATDASSPTAAALLARLRSVGWQARLDPDCQQRGGLLSTVRLPAGVRVNLDVTVALSTLAAMTTCPPDSPASGDHRRHRPRPGHSGRHRPHPSHPQPTDDPITTRRQRRGSAKPGPAPHHNGGVHHHSPDCGTVLDFGRTTYRPPTPVIDRVNTPDTRCRFPGCALPATRRDHDHRTPYDQDGATCPCNLDALCRFHHRTKTFTTWTAHHDHTTNTLTWTSPLGRTHTDRPAPHLPTGTPINLADPRARADAAVIEPVPGAGLAVGDEDCRHSPGYEADRDPGDPPF